LKPGCEPGLLGVEVVAPVFAPGRGLKLFRFRAVLIACNVAPVFAPGRGLKQRRVARLEVGGVSPRCSHRGAD